MEAAFTVREAAALLGVSDDTIRRWADAGRLHLERVGSRSTVPGRSLAALAQELAAEPAASSQSGRRTSARNRMTGLVTRVQKDGVMAQVDIQAGPFRLVSLMTREAADELGLEPGSVATASVKATNVTIEVP